MTPQTNMTAEFIHKSISLADNSQYVPEYDKFVSLTEAKHHEDVMSEFWKDASTEKEKLLTSMKLLKEKTRSKDGDADSVDTNASTWQEVVSAIQGASNAENGTRLAKMCDKANIFQHWLNLLPSGDYTSTISGAFIMAFQVARASSSLNKTISEALASIPDTLSHASTYVEIYKTHSSDALVEMTAALCKAILHVLRLMVDFFLKNSIRRGSGLIMKGSAYQQRMTESIQEMKKLGLRLREEANVCLQKRIAEMDRKSELRASREQMRHELSKEELLLAIDSSTEITAQKVCTYLLRQLQSNPEFSIRIGGPLGCEGINQLSIEEDNVALGETGIDLVTIEHILDIIDYDNDTHLEDIKYCLTLGYTQGHKFQGRSTWALQSPDLAAFLDADSTEKLLVVNGNDDATQFLSPLSHACAKMSDLMMVCNNIISLVYFCGRHTDEFRDPRANAHGLVSELLGQLLTHVKDDASIRRQLDVSSVLGNDCNAIEQEDPAALYDLFRSIINQLPKGTVVFCIIDGISAYENSARRDDTYALMQQLARLSRKSKRVAFKCMITYPGRSGSLGKWSSDQGHGAASVYVPEII